MADDLSSIIPTLIVGGMATLRENSIMPRLVNSSYSGATSKKGDTITIPLSSAITSVDVVPASFAPDAGDTTLTNVPIALNKWREAAFDISDEDVEAAMDDVFPMQAAEAVKSLANYVDNYLLGLYTQFFSTAGSAAAVPFAAGTTKDATDMRTELSNNLAPITDRWAVTDARAEGSALEVRAFQDLSWNGSPQGIIEGQLNRKLGFGWWMDQNVPTHTAGTADSYTVTGVNAIGSTSIGLSAGTGDFNEGDIVTFSGDPQTYVVTAAVSGPAPATIVISPALRIATAGGETATVTASHVVNLGFHRDAIGFASRPLRGGKNGITTASAVDPISGLAMRVEVKEEHKRQRVSYDILFGANVVRAEFGVRLLGVPG